MVDKQDFKKIEEYVYEIPKSYRPDMRVPARLYADEVLLEAALGDRSMEQLINTATLPGVVKYTLAMPDIHQGYGPPIGGVIPSKASTGIISPGAVGYDINCLRSDTLILHEHGYRLPIAEMENNWKEAELRCQDFEAEREATTEVARYLKIKPHNPVYRLVTEAGDEIVATADHPFWALDGMVEVEALKVGDQIAIYPFEGVPYEEPSDEVILDEEDFKRLLESLGKSSRGSGLEQIIAYLKKRDILPLRYDSPQLPYLLKVMGYLLGDGSIYFEKGRGQGVAWFYGKPEDLEEIRKDIAAIGFTPSRVYTREREHKITTTYANYEFAYVEHSFKVTGSSFAALLVALGIPPGKKTIQDYEVPAWLFKATLWQKRLFLAAFFGAELSTPEAFKERNYNFKCPVLSLNKHEGFVESGRTFLEGVAQLLAGFGVETNKISRRKEQKNKDGTFSYRLRLILSSKPESLLNLWGRVGFEYNHERRFRANAAIQYLKHKQQVVELREEVAEMAVAMHRAGHAPQKIYRELAGIHANERFLERSLYEGRKTKARVSSAFPTFDEYRQEATMGLGTSGMVWERIARLETISFDEYVYDFTVAHPDHNFIANGFVVSNCGVRLLRSNILAEEVKPIMDDIVNALFRGVPSGVGRSGDVRLSHRDMNDVLEKGSAWAVSQGYGTKDDLEHTEERGGLAGAEARAVSKRAKKRGSSQLGTLGSGNHFVEVGEVEEVYDQEVADAFGLFEGQMVVWIHTGSRGLGHQVCTDYVRDLQQAVHKYGIKLPDRELVCAPFDSPEGRDYFAAMAGAANYAWANRQVLAHRVRRILDDVLAGVVKDRELTLVYDLTHNIAKVEEHPIDGKPTKLVIHRKGATRAFGPGMKGLPADYREVGQPVLIPGDMGTASYVLVGTAEAMEKTFGTSCHGAGRVMSRRAAKRKIRGEDLQKELAEKGIVVKGGSWKGLAEEAPAAYKDVDRVVNVVHSLGIARKVARVVPLGVIKG
ncbi:MAG: intein-containing RctB family protein [Anaerolineae bacterium]|nr:intein-containing RctB family protein [Anaerolineae bacterium]